MLKCPYCGHTNHDDVVEKIVRNHFDWECSKCELSFQVTIDPLDNPIISKIEVEDTY